MASKTQKISRSNIVSITNAAMNDYGGQQAIMPQRKGGYGTTLVNSSGGEYDGGDRVIGFPNGFEVDGDLLFTTGWGDGFAVRRLNNDGSMTKLFQETYFLWRDTASTYNHMQSVAIDTINKLGVVMSYNVEGYTTFDYSGCTGSGTTFVKHDRPTHSTPDAFIGSQDTGGGYVNRVGTSYTSGLAAAGEWIYASDHDSHHYKKIMRRNLRTGAEERLDQTSSDIYLSGSGVIDRNGYRGCLFYDEVNDRMYHFPYYNANFTLIVSASTSSPKTVWCDMGDAGVGDDGYEQGFHCDDPVNYPNKIIVGGSDRIVEVDITPCLTGGDPTIVNQIYTNNASNVLFASNFRFGYKYQKTSGVPMDKHPDHPTYVRTHADRGYNMLGGFIDRTNLKTPGMHKYIDITEDTSNGYSRSVRHDYGGNMIRMASANGTKYWVMVGYGADGHRFMVWNDADDPDLLRGNWEVVFGTFTLDASANVDYAIISNVNLIAPAGVTITVHVSNNNGTDWESYDYANEPKHIFSTTGTQLRYKIASSGTEAKQAYDLGYSGGMICVYGTLHSAEKESHGYNITRKRLI